MPFRDRMWRPFRNSDSSGTISPEDSGSPTTTTTAHTSQSSESGLPGGLSTINIRSHPSTSSSSSHPRLALVKTFTLGRDPDRERRREERRERKQEKDDRRREQARRRLHPSERPLTAQNLRHQEMLRHFTMTFGASDQAMISRLSFQEGVSPCCTRPPSMDGLPSISADFAHLALPADGAKSVAV